MAVGENMLKLNFAPTLSPEDFKSFFILGSGWGSYSQKISATSGDVEVKFCFKIICYAIFRATFFLREIFAWTNEKGWSV